jgi:hypothetical protein
MKGHVMRTKEQAKQYNQTYYKKNKERLKAEATSYYHENKDKILDTVRKYRDENREIIREKGKDYYRRNISNRLFNAARARARKFGHDFDITLDDVIIPEVCPLLEIPLFVAEGRGSVKSNSASLDRIDSSKGYVKGNVWVISFKANTMKSDSTVEEFLLMAKNLKRYLK